MTREITWQEKSHDKRNHMAKRPMARERRKVKLVMATPAAPFAQSCKVYVISICDWKQSLCGDEN